MQNYARMPNDTKVVTSLWVTVRYALISIPITLIFGLILATLGNSEHLVFNQYLSHALLHALMIPVVASAVIFSGVMNTQSGWVNLALEAIGLPGPDWINSPNWITPAMVLIGLWGVGNLMLTLMAGMQGVPNELFEAADIDGANGWHKFRHITLPMISPVLFYNFTLMLIGTFKYLRSTLRTQERDRRPGGSDALFSSSTSTRTPSATT